MLIDTHAHINLHAFKDDADEVMQRSLGAGMTVINVGTEYSTSEQAVNMLAQYPNHVYAAVGLHPSHTYDNPHLDENESATRTGAEHFDTSKYRSIAQHPKVVGIGECGLDYYRLPESDPNQRMNLNLQTTHESIKLLQKDAFVEQIKLAQELDKALIIHCRPSKGTVDAYEDVLAIISNFPIRQAQGPEVLEGQFLISNEGSDLSGTPPHEEGQGEVIVKNVDTLKVSMTPSNSPSRGGGKELRFEIHSFTGPLEVAQKFIGLGGYIGLNGIITFDKTGNMETVVKGVPLEHIVLETDSPYLAPSPHRGKRNEPLYVQAVAEKIAEWKQCTVEAVALHTSENAKRLFKLE